MTLLVGLPNRRKLVSLLLAQREKSELALLHWLSLEEDRITPSIIWKVTTINRVEQVYERLIRRRVVEPVRDCVRERPPRPCCVRSHRPHSPVALGIRVTVVEE